jgi:hypothetical protein
LKGIAVRFFCVSILVCLYFGCDSHNADVGAHDGMGGHGGMNQGSEADTYSPGMEKTGGMGIYTVRLMQSAPIPRDTSKYTWQIQVLDADGNTVSDALVQAEPTMPAHGHGTMPQFTEGLESQENLGTYELTEMDLFMPGVWMISIRITGADEQVDMVMYHFQLEG